MEKYIKFFFNLIGILALILLLPLSYKNCYHERIISTFSEVDENFIYDELINLSKDGERIDMILENIKDHLIDLLYMLVRNQETIAFF